MWSETPWPAHQQAFPENPQARLCGWSKPGLSMVGLDPRASNTTIAITTLTCPVWVTKGDGRDPVLHGGPTLPRCIPSVMSSDPVAARSVMLCSRFPNYRP